MAIGGNRIDDDLVLYRIGARALAKRLRQQAEAGELRCEQCGAALVLADARVLLLECGHEVIVVPCPTVGCAGHEGQLFEPRGVGGHSLEQPGVALPLATWLRL
jgi:hypothetical protein